MMTLDEYSHLVGELEEGYPPPGLDSKEAIDRLIVEVCAAPWKTSQERNEAQSIAARLSRVSGRQARGE
jgi:hypothetical protein